MVVFWSNLSQAARVGATALTQPYNADGYWQNLLEGDFTTRGVGYPSLPLAFNLRLYRAMERAVLRVLRPTDIRGARILDIGAGSGYWIEFWRSRGALDVVGLDLTEVAVRRLRGAFPGHEFHRQDIGERLKADLGRFDLISAMSVLLHITEDARLSTAIDNLASLLLPGGSLVLIEPVVVHRWWGRPFDSAANSKARPLAEWEQRLADSGLSIQRVRPVTCLLANPVDTRRRQTFQALEVYWTVLGKFFGRSESLGRAAAAVIGPLDRLAVQVARTGPSTKCLVIRRTSPVRRT